MRRLLLAAFAAAVLPFSATATTIQLQDLSELVSGAQQVVQGRVLSAQAVEQGTIIVTEYRVEVSDWLKPGAQGSPATIVIRQPGGTIADVTMTVVGAAHFAVGEELILFTRDYSGLGQQVANLSQGALTVATEPVPPGTRLAAPPRKQLPQAAGFPRGGAPADLDAFKARVRELASARTP